MILALDSVLYNVVSKKKKNGWFKFPGADTKINEASPSVFIATRPQTARTLSSYPLITSSMCAHMHLCGCASLKSSGVHAFMCTWVLGQVRVSRRRRGNKRERLLYLYESMSYSTELLQGQEHKCERLVCVFGAYSIYRERVCFYCGGG